MIKANGDQANHQLGQVLYQYDERLVSVLIMMRTLMIILGTLHTGEVHDEIIIFQQ